MLSRNRSPSWVYPGSKFDLDFRNKRYWGGYADEKSVTEDKGSLLTDGGGYSSTCYTPQRNGILFVGGASSQNRITDLGYYQERGATNQALWARDMTNVAWVAVNVTAAKNQPGADNLSTANTASSITASAINGTILQTITLTSRSFIYSAYIKRLVGSGTISMTLDGTTYTDITSQINSMSYVLVQVALQTIANPIIGFKIAVSGDSIAVDFNQCESGTQIQATSKATTPLPTTTVAISRSNQTGYLSNGVSISTGNSGQAIVTNVFSTGGPFSMLMSWTGDVTTGTPNGPAMLATDFTAPSLWRGGIGIGFGISGTLTANTGTNGLGNWNKSCGRTNGKGTQFCLNGGSLSANIGGTANLPNVNIGGTHFNIGQNGAGTADLPLNGAIGRVTFWDREITDGQMIEYTRLSNPYDPY